MDTLNPDLFQLLLSLLPGFVAAWVFHGLTAHRKAIHFERVIQALIFTAFIFSTVSLLRMIALAIGKTWEFGTWTETLSTPSVSLIVGILYGLAFTCLANTSALHNWLPDFITKRTSYPSEWYSALNDKRYVYLHLDDKRRIYGWPSEFPDYPDAGHFVLMEAEWVLDDNRRAKLPVTHKILIPATKVVFVELEKRWDTTKWNPEDIEPISQDDLDSSVQILVPLQELDESDASKAECKSDKPNVDDASKSSQEGEE